MSFSRHRRSHHHQQQQQQQVSQLSQYLCSKCGILVKETEEEEIH
ncbi:MAG TPA: hypothetical protein VF233_08130 [Nitrososphaeraceae archaeon]